MRKLIAYKILFLALAFTGYSQEIIINEGGKILYRGYKNVVNISDGFSGGENSKGWQAAGLPWKKLKK